MKKFILMCREFSNQLKEDNVSAYASSCAFFIFLSFIPLIILVVAILPYTPITENDMLSLMGKLFPEDFMSAISMIIEEVYGRSIGIISVSAITAIWSAGKGFNSLVYGLNAIEQLPEKRNSVIVRIASSFYTILFLVSVILLLIIMVYGKIAGKIIVGYFPGLSNLMEILLLIRTLIMIVFMTIIFILCYAFLPCKRHGLFYQIPGAVFSAIAWVIFSYFFFLYVEMTNAFSMYGSLTMIVVLMFWLYCLMYIVLFGANINKYLRPLVKAYQLDREEKSENEAALKDKEKSEKEEALKDKKIPGIEEALKEDDKPSEAASIDKNGIFS